MGDGLQRVHNHGLQHHKPGYADYRFPQLLFAGTAAVTFMRGYQTHSLGSFMPLFK